MKKRNFWKDMKIFMEPAMFLRDKYLQALFQKMFDAVFAVGSVWFLEQAIKSIESWEFLMFKKYVLLYIWAVIIFYPMTYALRYWVWNYYPETKKFLDKKYIGNFVIMDNNQAEWIWTWRLIAIIEKWLQYWMDLIKISMMDWSKTFFTISFWLIYMTTIIHWDILYVIAGMIPICIAIYYINIKAVKRRKKRRDVQHTMLRSFVRIVMSKFEILQSKKKEFEIKSLRNLHDEWYIYHKKTADHVRLIFIIPLFLVGILTAIIVWNHGKWIFETGTWFGELTALLVVIGLIVKMLHGGVDFYRAFTKDWIHVEKVLELFEGAKYLKWYDKWKKFQYKDGHIEIKNLLFQYPQNEKIFSNFNLIIEGKKKTALVGASGSGKTTLVKLISGYLTANSGSIEIDGQSLSEISLKSYYKHIGYLTQEPSIFDGTIRENMMYAITKEVSEKELEQAIVSAKCDFIHKFKKGLSTEIWEKWVRLSGGQRQRLAIAKIFLKNPEIIILDEPTSALDSFAEEKITEAMHNLYKNRTVIIVAHRLQTVKNADAIIVMDEWKVIESWSHKNLIKKNGYYAKMLELQSGF